MQAASIPTKFAAFWAQGAAAANVRVVPNTSPAGAPNGTASFLVGFPPSCFTPIAAGGSWPFGQDVNGVLRQSTQWNQWQQAGGPIAYDAAFASAISGYPIGAVVSAAALGRFWLSTVDGNASNPDAGGGGWIGFGVGPTAMVAFAATATWTPPAGVEQVRVRLVGGGAGGAGSPDVYNSGGGGGAGGYCEGIVNVNAVSPVNITIGVGGAGGVGTTGTNGATTSFGGAMSATGGVAGQGYASYSAGGQGGQGYGGALNIPGGYGTDGRANTLIFPGNGGSSYFGGGGRGAVGGHSGINGQAPGSGGGGIYINADNGGRGADGIVIVEW